MDGTEPKHGVVFAFINMVDELVESDRETVIDELNTEIDRVQSRYSVLCALRDSLLPEESSEELPLDETSQLPSLSGLEDLELLIVQYVSKHGPATPAEIAAAIGVHHTKIGRIVSKSNALVRDGKLITVKLS